MKIYAPVKETTFDAAKNAVLSGANPLLNALGDVTSAHATIDKLIASGDYDAVKHLKSSLPNASIDLSLKSSVDQYEASRGACGVRFEADGDLLFSIDIQLINGQLIVSSFTKRKSMSRRTADAAVTAFLTTFRVLEAFADHTRDVEYTKARTAMHIEEHERIARLLGIL